MSKQLQVTEQEKIRREKLEELKKLGINPYPAELFPVNNFSSELIENFDDKKQVIIAGRIMSRRIQGNASFAEIQDSKGRIQVYFNRDEITIHYFRNFLVFKTLFFHDMTPMTRRVSYAYQNQFILFFCMFEGFLYPTLPMHRIGGMLLQVERCFINKLVLIHFYFLLQILKISI